MKSRTVAMVAMELALFILLAALVFAQPPLEDKACFQGNTKKAEECCPLPRLMNKTIADKCNEENKGLAPRPAPGTRKTEGSCVTECIFRTIGAYNATTKALNKTAVLDELMKTAGHSKDFAPLFNSSIEMCYNKVMENPSFNATPVSPIPGRAGCTFLPPALMDCVKIQLFTKCPPNLWNKAPECERSKGKITTGCSYSSIVMG